MKKTVLIVANDETLLCYAEAYFALTYPDIVLTSTRLSDDKLSDALPCVATVLEQYRQKNYCPDAVLLIDTSLPEDHKAAKELHAIWEDKGAHLATIQRLKKKRLTIHAQDAYPDEAAEKTSRLREQLAAVLQAKEVGLIESRGATESLMMNMAPSRKGVDFIRSLRNDTCFCKVPIVVDGAFENKSFLAAGATAVRCSYEPLENKGYELVAKALGVEPRCTPAAVAILDNGPRDPKARTGAEGNSPQQRL